MSIIFLIIAFIFIGGSWFYIYKLKKNNADLIKYIDYLKKEVVVWEKDYMKRTGKILPGYAMGSKNIKTNELI